MAQKTSAHPRVTNGTFTLTNGIVALADGVVAAIVAVPHMTANSVVKLMLRTPASSAVAGGTRYEVTKSAGSFAVRATDLANPANTIATDDSVFDYLVIHEPAYT